jgi:hypothetical protein
MKKRVNQKKCTYEGCDKKATHGYGYMKGDRCKKHKEDRKPQTRLRKLREEINNHVKRIEAEENRKILEIHKLYYDEV